ncbi:unnamed protein product [Pleuronectes platessa]|uniref:Uncharacterized protein n=1 Tax=Pleuronectes platessa TaxID=8262 RepID=A0A9N7VYQ2_PLEPL|nr:unnamed protein product [Pleuronectes platessa]
MIHSQCFYAAGSKAGLVKKPDANATAKTRRHCSYKPYAVPTCYPGCQTNLAPPTTFEVGKFGLESLRWGDIMPGSKVTGPIRLSGRALYDDGQMINEDIDSAFILKEEQRTRRRRQSTALIPIAPALGRHTGH